MSGSIKWLKYTTDGGDVFGYQADESNAENVIVADDPIDVQTTDMIKYSVPSNVGKRTATFKSTTTVRKKVVVIPTVVLFQALIDNDGTLVSRSWNDAELGEQFVLSGVSPETMRPIVGSVDTGLNDGDVT